MRTISIHHVPFEGLGSIETLVGGKNHTYTRLDAWTNPTYPETETFDTLIIMGGPMSVGDTESLSWLPREKSFIKKSIASGKMILGICLGAQLIAEALGARVKKGPMKEIGWFEVTKHPRADESIIGSLIPGKFEAFHWHGETFDIPAGALPIGSSEACNNQGFVLDDRIISLQFHLETTPETAGALIKNCSSDLNDDGDFVQDAAEMVKDPDRFYQINRLMRRIWVEMEKIKP
ncbi:MAG: type 1 glutamine amidotransferase [Spirochaetaceae bacterium]|nr:type 1 glutamine amidotransferase [Spirochaetaceae bacterium]